MWPSCCGTRATRFKHMAEPVLKDLNAKKNQMMIDGQKYARLALEQKREAVQFFKENERFSAEARARDALHNDQQAEGYMKKRRHMDFYISEIQKLRDHYDYMESMSGLTETIERLGVAQKREQEGDEEIPSIADRIEAMGQAEAQFKALVADMDNEISKVSVVDHKDPDDIFAEIQKWNLGVLKPIVKDMSPDQLEMVA